MNAFKGELFALAAVLCWTVGALCVEAASKRAGILAVNIIRLMLSCVFLTILVVMSEGQGFGWEFDNNQMFWLVLSGLIGLFFGDICLFAAFLEIGPRLSMLIFSLAAPLSALIGFIFLDEVYLWFQWLGMMVALAGVAMVILEKAPALDNKGKKKFRVVTRKGLILALGGVVGQAVAAVMSKHGMADGNALEATQIRIFSATAAFILFFAFKPWWSQLKRSFESRTIIIYIIMGAILGSTIGLAFAMASYQLISMGRSNTILATVPIFMIPFAILLHKEHVSIRALFGTLVAFGGIYMMMMQA